MSKLKELQIPHLVQVHFQLTGSVPFHLVGGVKAFVEAWFAHHQSYGQGSTPMTQS